MFARQLADMLAKITDGSARTVVRSEELEIRKKLCAPLFASSAGRRSTGLITAAAQREILESPFGGKDFVEEMGTSARGVRCCGNGKPAAQPIAPVTPGFA